MEGVTDLLAVQTCPSCLLQPNESLTRTPGLNVSAGRGAVARQRHVVGHGEERAERSDLGGEGHEAVQRQKYTCLARVSPPTAPAWCLCEGGRRTCTVRWSRNGGKRNGGLSRPRLLAPLGLKSVPDLLMPVSLNGRTYLDLLEIQRRQSPGRNPA